MQQEQQQQQLPRKLRVLCLHSWRTSGAIFKQQFRRVNLDVALADLMDFVSWARWLTQPFENASAAQQPAAAAHMLLFRSSGHCNGLFLLSALPSLCSGSSKAAADP
jgi:hypothetical protein